MILKNIHIENSIPIKNFSKKPLKIFKKKYSKILKEIKKDIEDNFKTLNVLNSNFKLNFNIKELKKFKKYNNIVIIGMGGSILGSEAIYDFFKEKIKKNIYFVNNIDETKMFEIKKKINFKNTLFIVISKSGNTIETIANFLYLKILKKNLKNILIISEKKDNFLYKLSEKNELYYLEHNSNIGGRYSVLSVVGLVPAYLMGINIFNLRKNIKKFFNHNANKILKESSIKLAYFLKYKKYPNLIFLNYSSHLEKFLFWLQQLIAESLGKNKLGFLPVVSNAPKDHHSLLQLYLDGPKDKLFYIFNSEEKSKIKLDVKKFTKNFDFIHKKNLNKIKFSQKNALISTFKRNKTPFREIVIKENREETLGELFSYFIVETVVIGKLVGINPFDQPSVEQVKRLTKKILS